MTMRQLIVDIMSILDCDGVGSLRLIPVEEAAWPVIEDDAYNKYQAQKSLSICWLGKDSSNRGPTFPADNSSLSLTIHC